MPKPRLAIVTSHPIQYYAPVFRELTALGAIDVRVFYTWSQSADQSVYDPAFRTDVAWDVPLLTDYAYQFVPNIARQPGTHHFAGLKNPALIREIEQWRADVLLVYGWYAHSHLKALCHFKRRIPVLFRGDSTLLDRQPSWRELARRGFLRWVYSHVDVALAVGSNSRDYFLWCGLPPEKIAIAPHSVDTDRFSADAPSRQERAEAWRLSLGIAPDAVVFLFAGKLQRKKDPQLLLRAFGALDQQRSRRAHLLFVGNGDLEDKLKAEAAAHDNVHFVSFQNQSKMPDVYRLGDLYVLPSRGPGETWGLAINEAMACARASIASSKVGGARDLIQQGTVGWTFPAGEVRALESVLESAVDLGRPALLSMGARAAESCDRWSTREAARRMADVVLRSN